MRRDRRQDLLLTLVMLGIALTPGWLLPRPWSTAWLAFTLLLAGPSVWWSLQHAPWQPTPQAELSRLLAALAVPPGAHFGDLGAGDGRLVRAVHRATGARCTGIEASPLLYLLGVLRTLGTASTRMRWGDLYRADWSEFDVVYVWGTAYSVSQSRFGDLAARAVATGTRVVSYHHPVHGLCPSWTDDRGPRPIFVYEPGTQAEHAAIEEETTEGSP